MPRVIRHLFSSWQSDLPSNLNQSFIQEALERVAKRLANNATLEVEPQVEHDTTGVASAPDSTAIIFEQIATTDILVDDVSFINPSDSQRRGASRICPSTCATAVSFPMHRRPRSRRTAAGIVAGKAEGFHQRSQETASFPRRHRLRIERPGIIIRENDHAHGGKELSRGEVEQRSDPLCKCHAILTTAFCYH